MDKHIYDICSKKMKSILQSFCDTINESDSDIMMVMAQKALCLYKLLYKQGLINRPNVIASSAIDFLNIDLSSKKVDIIEDIIVSGSAVSTIANKLFKLGLNEDNIRIIALATDANYLGMDFSNDKQKDNALVCEFSLEDSDCIELSYEISRIFAYYGIPYDTDYPVYDEIAYGDKLKNCLFGYSFWDIYEITNESNIMGGISSLTLFPGDIVLSELWSRVGVNFSPYVHIKVRVYINENENWIRFVPMVSFNEIDENDLEIILDHFEKNLWNESIVNHTATLRAKFRFMQYYLSNDLMMIVAEICNIKSKINLNLYALNMQFGEFSINVKDVLLSEKVKIELNNINIKSIKPDMLLCEAKSIDENNVENLNELLLLPFIKSHKNKELKDREEMKKRAFHFKNDFEKIEKYSDRLRKGYSFSALLNLFLNSEKNFNLERFISVFIDRSIDLGIIVPIIYHNRQDKYYCRAYRHGEDLPFGMADKIRLMYFLKYFDNSIKEYKADNAIANISFEKIIVLFYQIGLRKNNIFNRFLGFDNYPLLLEKFCVHGAIATTSTEKEHFYTQEEGNVKDIWITRWLLQERCIYYSEDNGRQHYSICIDNVNSYIDLNELNSISETIKTEIECIARIIGFWYACSKNSKDKFKKDLIILTSCSNPYNFLSAISTEIHYFKKYWEHQVQDAFHNRSYEYKYSLIEQSLKSGYDKYECGNVKKCAVGKHPKSKVT